MKEGPAVVFVTYLTSAIASALIGGDVAMDAGQSAPSSPPSTQLPNSGNHQLTRQQIESLRTLLQQLERSTQ